MELTRKKPHKCQAFVLSSKVVRLDIKQSRKGPLYLQLNTYQQKKTEPVPGCPQPETAWKPPASGGNPAQEGQPFTDDISF